MYLIIITLRSFSAEETGAQREKVTCQASSPGPLALKAHRPSAACTVRSDGLSFPTPICQLWAVLDLSHTSPLFSCSSHLLPQVLRFGFGGGMCREVS